MNILIVSGTPKKGGLSYRLTEAAKEAALNAGANAEVIELTGLTACRMCGDGWGECKAKRRCIFGDDDNFNIFHEKTRWADNFVFITPVYWGEVSEGMKIFLDKLRRCESSKRDPNEAEPKYLEGKSSILVASAGGGGGGITSTFVQMERAINHLGGATYPYSIYGFFDYIAVNRWNQEFKVEALMKSVAALVKHCDERTNNI